MTQTDPEVIKRLTTAEQAVEDLVMPEITVDLISPFLQLPGLRLFVPMSGFDSAGNATDMSGLGHHMTYNGNPTYNDDGLAPYIDLDGTGDYLSHADHADFDILGTETYVAAKFRGLTWGGWFWFDVITGVAGLISKQDGGLSYVLQRNAGDVAAFIDDGLGGSIGSGAVAVATAQWYFIFARFNPSLELKVGVNAFTNTNIVGIPASIRNLAGALAIGMQVAPATNPLDGRASCCFICAASLLDATLSALFESTKAAYGVD